MSVDLTLAKAQCRVTSSSEDTIITAYLNAAIAFVENYTRKKLTAASSVEQYFAGFPSDNGSFLLSWGPSIANVEISYTDEAGDPQTITTARLVKDKVFPAANSEWPTPLGNTEVTVSYDVGYTTVPSDIDNAVLLLVGEYYDNRRAGMASPASIAAIHSLCEPYRLPSLR